jgi:hypothetical protein
MAALGRRDQPLGSAPVLQLWRQPSQPGSDDGRTKWKSWKSSIAKPVQRCSHRFAIARLSVLLSYEWLAIVTEKFTEKLNISLYGCTTRT